MRIRLSLIQPSESAAGRAAWWCALLTATVLLGAWMPARHAEAGPDWSGAPPSEKRLRAWVPGRAPQMDGSLQEWERAPETAIARLEEKRQLHPTRRDAWQGASDASAVVRFAVHGDDLYLGITFVDDRVAHDPTWPWWHGDSLELFVNPDLVPGEPPPHVFTENCRQIFIMPANPELPWSVAYQGRRVVFDDGDLRGVEVIRGPGREGAYDAEVRIPLFNFGLRPGESRSLGLALALNDADEAPEKPGSYLSWNEGFDLYLHPDHFGVLEIPSRPDIAAAPGERRGSRWWWLLVALLAGASAFLLAGRGAEVLARVGPRAKLIGLLATALVGIGFWAQAEMLASSTEEDVRRDLEAAATAADEIARQAEPFLPAAADSTARTVAVANLLRGRRIDARAGVLDATLVPLHAEGAFRSGRVPRYDFDLGEARRFVLAEEVEGHSFELVVESPLRSRGLTRRLGVGTLGFHAHSGAEEEAQLTLALDADTSETIRLELENAGPWREVTWTPDLGAPPTRLRSLAVLNAAGERRPLLLPGQTRDRVPVLANGPGPNQGRDLAPASSLTIPLPVLPGADRLWLLLSPARAFPQLLGDETLARIQIEYASGPTPAPVELRNGEHLTAERLIPGIQRPQDLRSRVAFSWRDNMGYTRVQQALPIPLDPQRVASQVSIENLGPGGMLRIVAATVARTGRAPEDALIRVVADQSGRDGLVLAPGLEDFSPWLPLERSKAPTTSQQVRLRRGLGAEPRITLTFSAPLPGSVAEGRERAQVILLICLGVALFLGVLLVVDAAGHLHLLSWRLGAGVLAAALVPLAVTIVIVERENSRRIEGEHAARMRAAAQDVEGRLQGALERVKDAARQMARHLVAEGEAGANAEIQRLAHLYGGAALGEGLAGTVAIGGARLPALLVPLGRPGAAQGLRGPRVLQGSAQQAGVHTSPWDGLLLVGTARRGRAENWVRVTLGVRVEDAFLAAGLRSGMLGPETAAVVVDEQGRALGRAGPLAETLRRRLEARLPDLVNDGAGADLEAGAEGRELLVVARRLGSVSAERGAWLALGLDRAVIDRALDEERAPLIWLALFGLVLVVGVAALVARRVADPVRALVLATDAVRQGDFDVVVPDAGSDEVGRLAVSFDQMRRDLKHRVEDLDFLRSAQDALAASLEFERRAKVALQLFQGRLRPDDALLLDTRGVGGPVRVVAEAGGEARYSDRPFTPAPEGWLARTLSADAPLEVRPTEDDPSVQAAAPMAQRLLESCAAWIATPMRTGNEVHAVLLMGWKDAAELPRPEDRRLLEPLAGITAAALNNARLYRLAALDEVTGLPGATAFEAALRRDVDVALEGGPAAVLLRIALDHVEHVTLRRGVELSRELQRACANALLGVVGDPLQLGRLREEQLAVRIPGATPDEVRSLADRIRERLGRVEVRPEEGGEAVITTISIGVARCPGDARSLEFLLDAAGRALAAAQREGGDRVEDAARLTSGAVTAPPFEEGAIFRNEVMVRLVESAQRAARTDSSVLITGETGTGKEIIANLIHRRSARATRPLVTVNCAAFPETLLESELFGHERGAFTGADRRREGRFELADGGTLFMDEVAEMAPSAQVKLLRVLQERQFTRLGGTRTIAIDVRIVAATNKDLEQAVASGSFREDLYYRLNVIRLEIPPLRERREEIPPLVDQFLRECNQRAGRGPRALTSAAMDVLYRHPWPGNVRELKNVIERCTVLCEAEFVGPEDLQLDIGFGEGGAYLPPRGAPQDDLNARQRKLLDHLARHGRCTNREYYEMAGTSPRTGLRDLQDLMRRGLLVREGKRRGAVYRLP